MNLRIVRTILAKELRETLRDKRTLIAMIGIPVVLYPVLIIVSVQAAAIQRSRIESTSSSVALAANATPTTRTWVESIDKVTIVESADPAADLKAGRLDAIVGAESDAEAALEEGRSAEIRIEYDSTESRSRAARDRIREALRDRGAEILAERLEARGLDKQFAEPLKIESKDVASPQKKTGTILGATLPMIMIIMLGVGAFYPAVDLTAGEKERGTFETLLSTPTSKQEIVAGKFLTVFSLSMFTALLNLGSMIGSILFVIHQQTSASGNAPIDLSLFQVSFVNVLIMIGVLTPLAFFICSVMMAIALLARDFKEAQNLVTPFYILIILPGAIGAMPDAQLTKATQFIPIANVSLLFKQLLMQTATAEHVFAVMISTGAYALASLTIAVWLFQREEVILSEDKGFPLTLRRSVFKPRAQPTAGLSLLMLAGAMLLLFYIGTVVQARDVIVGTFITQWLLFFVPVVAVLWYVRVDLKTALSLRPPPLLSLPAVVLMAPASMILVMQVTAWQHHVLPMPPEIAEQFNELFNYDGSTAGLIKMLLAIGVSAAICEEILFRGAVLSGLRTRLSPAAAIVLTGVLFGLFHMSVYRLLPTALLGIAITYVVLRTGSIWTGMLYHLIHNSLGVLMATENMPESVLDMLKPMAEPGVGPPIWLVAAAVPVLAAGVMLIELSRRHTPDS